MNRFRINQILRVLLFPFTDPKLQYEDPMLKRYLAYREILNLRPDSIVKTEEKAEKNYQYQHATEDLIKYLSAVNKTRVKSYDDLLMICELFYPMLDLEKLMNKIQKRNYQAGKPSDPRENIALFYLENLVKIAHSLLTYRDGVAAIRTWNNTGVGREKDIFHAEFVFDKVEIWNLLCRMAVPDIFIAIFAVESNLDETALYEQKPHISLADKLLIKTLKKGMAENHLHFNAGYDYETFWINKVNLWKYADKREVPSFLSEDGCLAAAVFRIIAAWYFESGAYKKNTFLQWDFINSNHELQQVMRYLYTGQSHNEKVSQWQFGWLWPIAASHSLSKRQDYLLYTVYFSYLELKTSSEFILLYHCYKYIKEHGWDTGFARIFIQYIRIKNNFFQSNQQTFLIPGLRHFQEYFRHGRKTEMALVGKEGLALDVFRTQAKIVGLKKLEIRITPMVREETIDCFDYEKERDLIKASLYKQLYDIFYLYRRYILESILGVRQTDNFLEMEQKRSVKTDFSFHELQQQICQSGQYSFDKFSIPTLGIIYHFIKAENPDNISGYVCWQRIDDPEAQYSGHRLFARQRMINTAIAIEEIRTEVPGISEYLVGIDAASDENAMEPWMFAPAYNLVRSKTVTKPVLMEETHGKHRYFNIQNVGFTYHVGEDFRHILSGLRHIDEVVEEFHYKPGDRLGHAMALGLNIEKWAKNNEIIPIPIMEHMENLLWMWGKNINNEVEFPLQLEVLENKIINYAEKIYGKGNGITVRMLYQAYKKKFSHNHNNVIRKQLREKQLQTEVKQQNCRYSNESCITCAPMWTEESLLCTNYCPVFIARGNEVCMVSITKSEVEAYEILQNYLMEKVEQRGIYIETNPTSNITIGDVDDLLGHPIFRMSSLDVRDPQRHHIMVTVNSDDSAVFNTNVENELSYIYYAMEHSGYPKEDILIWLDQVRENGLNASFISKVKDTSTILDEICNILDFLNPYV